MDGIAILQEYITRNPDWKVAAFMVACLMALVITTLLRLIQMTADCESINARITSFVLILCEIAMIFAVGRVGVQAYNTAYTVYVVTVEDCVNFNELTEHYEILSNDGDIYTVIERACEDESN